MGTRRLLQVFVVSMAGSFLGLTLFVSTGMWPSCDADGDPCACDTDGVACCNGDVNGDHSINLADAVYILQYLFSNGPAPVAFEEAPCRFTGRLSVTGQELCYTRDDNSAVPCDSCADCEGQDGYHQAGVPFEGRYTDNGDGTITDNHTGLMWPQGVSEEKRSWWDALEYCADLEFAGYTDWRLPNNAELGSLSDLGRGNSVDIPAIDPIFQMPLGFFWTSTTVRTSPAFAVCGENVIPLAAGKRKSEVLFVMPVRTIE
jgi:hypothetical protein